MKPQMNLFAAVTVLACGALGMGCYEEAGIYEYDTAYGAGYNATPTLVAAGPGVWMVSGQPSPVYYADNYYWMSSGSGWYRSSYYNGGWGSVNMNVLPSNVGYHYSTNYGYSHRTHYVGAQPHVVGQGNSHVYTGQTRVGAQPHVSGHVSSSPRVYTGQTHVGHTSVSHSFGGGGGHSFGGGGHSFGGGGHSFGGGGHGHR